MSTRCQTRVISRQKEDNGQFSEDITLYHHYDGMPERMVPLFWQAYQFGVTPAVPDWKKNDPNAIPVDHFQYQAFRAGYAASYLCHIDPRGFQPENSHELHGDIEWYYKIYVSGKNIKGQEYKQWELEIYKAKIRVKGAPLLKKVLKRTQLCHLVNANGEFDADILAQITKSLSTQPA